MNIHDRQSTQARGCHQRTTRVLEQGAAQYFRCANELRACVQDKPDHERFREKKDCSCSESTMGKLAASQASGQEKEHERGSQSEVVGQVESFLAGEEGR